MKQNQSTKEILERAQGGDTDAFRMLYDQLVDRVFRYALARVHDRELARDITQEAFISLWENLHRFTYRSDEEWYGFVFLIVRRRITDARRKHKDETLTSAGELGTKQAETPIRTDPFDQERLEIHLDKLPERMREVVLQRYWAGLSFASIARALRITESHARVLHHRAIQSLHTTFHSYEA